MIRRSIAALVVAILCWISLPVAFGLPQSAMRPESLAASHEHDCCPQVHPKIAPILLLTNFSMAMPCGEQHPCCARRVPSNPTTLPVETKVVRPAAEKSLAIVFHETSPNSGQADEINTTYFLPPPFERSTVLRI